MDLIARSGRSVPLLLCVVLLLGPAGNVTASPQAAPEPSADNVVTETVVPVVANLTGMFGIEWRTQLFLSNDVSREVDVAVTLPGVDGPFYFTSLAPGASVNFNDVIRETFGLDRAMGPLLIRTSGRFPVTAIASIYGVRDGNVVGVQRVPVLAQPPFGTLRLLSNLILSDNFRTNVGLVNYSERPVTFSAALQRISGRDVATTVMTVAPDSVTHMSMAGMFPLVSDGGTYSIVVEASSPQSFAYASVLNNDTNDARFVDGSVIFYRPF